MERSNESLVTEFIFVGLSNEYELQVLLFVTFFLAFNITVLGNVGISALIWTDSHLHTPMYFFLLNLSCVDLCCSSSITPKLLATILSDNKTISFLSCAVQLFCFALLAPAECLLLEVMAYDRYVAICKPLLYSLIINQQTCVHFLCATYILSLLNGVLQVSITFSQSFCKDNVIDHFFCDVPALLRLSCSDTSTLQMVVVACATFFAIGSFGIIITSYCFIISTILRIPSLKGRYKAFSTCASHFIVVLLYFGSAFTMYFVPASSSVTQNKALPLFYTVVIPMLNPLIYSLRNKDVKRSLKKSYQWLYKMIHNKMDKH